MFMVKILKMQKKINTMPKKNIKIIIKNIEISKIQSWL
jgi:hypothetical protein